MSNEQMALDDLNVDMNNLYREESFTDLKIASIKRLTPIKTDGSDDDSRETLFIGQTQLMSQAGPLPVHCQLPASSLDEAIAIFPQAVKEAVERMVDEAREMQRQESSRIITPGRPGDPKIHMG